MKKLYGGLIVVLLLAAITSVGYASDTRHKTKKEVAELVLPAIDAAIPDGSETLYSAVGYNDCFEIVLVGTPIQIVSETYKSRPGHYRFLDGANKAIPYSMRY